MVRKNLTFLCIVGGLSVLASWGCTAEERSTEGTGTVATTPQEKARREQLAEMQKQDAAEASSSGQKTRHKERTSPRQRRTEQRVVDQPRRP
jgi:hypothetical protein